MTGNSPMPAFVSVRSRESLVLFVRLFAAALAVHFAYIEIMNDHFDRISRGQQILAFGAVPFRDFFDPGWLLTIYTSAAAQAVFGHRLLGEVVVTGLFTAAGIALAGVLVRAACNSRGAGATAAVLLLMAQPRAYDYDKVFFYAFGLFMCWSYAEAPSRRRAIALALTTVAAGLYRYDNGIYVAAAALVTIATVHWRDNPFAWRRIALFACAASMACAPAALFVATHAGASEAIRQVVTYAQVERERTRLREWPRPAIDWSAPLFVIEPPSNLAGLRALVQDPRVHATEGIDRRRLQVPWATRLRATRVLPGWLTRQNAEAFLYTVLVCLPPLAIVGLSGRRFAPGAPDRAVTARGLAAVALCGLSGLLVLRDPVDARYAAVAVPGVVLGAWLLWEAPGRLAGMRRRIRTAVAIAVVGIAAVSAAMLSSWVERLEPLVTHDEEESALERLLHERRERWSWLTSSSPDSGWIYGYLARCTAPTDRVLVADFQPQLPFYAGRGFAGGMLVFFGDHWSSPGDQQQIVQRLRRESVPIVISRLPDPLVRWPAVLDYVRREYVRAGQSAFGRNPDQLYEVHVRRTMNRPASRDVQWGFPCFSAAP